MTVPFMDLDVVFVHDDFLLIPLADGLQETAFAATRLYREPILVSFSFA